MPLLSNKPTRRHLCRIKAVRENDKLEFNELKEHVIARRAKPDVAISKGFHLNFVGFSLCSEGIATPV